LENSNAMEIQDYLLAAYMSLAATYIAFTVFFIWATSRGSKNPREDPPGEEHKGMHPAEKKWLIFLLIVAAIVNGITLAPLLPSMTYNVYAASPPDKVVEIHVKDYQFIFPEKPIRVKVGQLVEFRVYSEDVTYGFGVFEKNGRMVFQMQVVPGYTNSIKWVFTKPGTYDVRSTEYAGPKTPEMYYPDIIVVEG